MTFSRKDGRSWDEMRPISFQRGFTCYAEGSVLASFGQTKVICTATVEEKVPPFLKGTGKGWVTAEYSMLPRSTSERVSRIGARGFADGRSTEIQRLVGRSLRACVDLSALGERTVILDCDVIQADGGTRTAAVSGAFVALVDSFRFLRDRGLLSSLPIRFCIAAVSAGKVTGEPLLDLSYGEDSIAEVDMNFVMNEEGQYAEIQGTGEGCSFSGAELQLFLALARKGTGEVLEAQRKALLLHRDEYASR